MHRSIEVRFESHAIIIDVGKALFMISNNFIGSKSFFIHGNNFFKANTQRENLKAAAIGEGGTRPIHKATEAAGLIQNIWTRLQIQVIGIC